MLVATPLTTVAVAPSAAPAHLRAGARLGQIRIPRIGLVASVDQGAQTLYTAAWPRELNRGTAHYPGTALPWQQGTVGIAGHRVTHTRPFRYLNRVRKHDLIVLRTRWGIFRYRVYATKIVKPTGLWVLGGRRGHRLVLTACHPAYSDTHRIVVFARIAGGHA